MIGDFIALLAMARLAKPAAMAFFFFTASGRNSQESPEN
jgi:hypothetical protein